MRRLYSLEYRVQQNPRYPSSTLGEGMYQYRTFYKVAFISPFMNVKINIHEPNSNIEGRLTYVDRWNVPEKVKKELRIFLNDLGRGKVNKGVQVSERTQVKYISLLRSPLIYFSKPIEKITKKDLEKYDDDLSKDKLISEKKKPFSLNMKKDIRIALRVLLRWKFGETKANEITDFFDTRDIKKTPDYLKETEIEKLYKACKTDEERYIIAVLFDSGARAEEFINLRYEDIELPDKNNNFPKITIKEEYSKTDGRTISLYWHNSAEAITDFVRERIKQGIKTNEPIITMTYDAVRFFISRLSQRVLKKPLHLHLLRHSSATHYATKLNRQQLCYRYGWKFSSDMPDVYISRAGMNNKEIDEKFESTELGELKNQLKKEEFERKLNNERMGKILDFLSSKIDELNLMAQNKIISDKIKKLQNK